MSIFRITLILDDTVGAQATLLTSIQNTLSSIAGNLPPATVPPSNNIEVKKLS